MGKRCAVLGGGITGLVAAWRLQKAGAEPVLFESSDRVGGVIQSVREGGYLAECGPNTLMDTAPEIGELIRELGLEDRKWLSNPAAEAKYVVRGGRPQEIPSSPPAFFSSPFFSWKAKANLLAEPFRKKLPADAPEESLADFVLRRLGQEFLDYAINPMVAGIYAGDPHQLSVKEAFPKIFDLEQKYGSLIRGQILGARERKKRGTVSKQNAPKLSFDEGLEVLPQTLLGVLGNRVRLNQSVSVVEKTGRNWLVNGEAFDAVIFAMPAFRLAEMKVAGEAIFSPLEKVKYPPVASVVLGYEREQVQHSLNGFGALVPEVENRSILGTIFSSSLFPNRAPEGHVLLTCYVGGTREPELALLPEKEIFAKVEQDLQELYGVTGEPTYRFHFLHRRAIPQYNVGFGKVRDLLKELEKAHPRLHIAGNCRDGIALSDSIVSGWNVAEKVIAPIG